MRKITLLISAILILSGSLRAEERVFDLGVGLKTGYSNVLSELTESNTGNGINVYGLMISHTFFKSFLVQMNFEKYDIVSSGYNGPSLLLYETQMPATTELGAKWYYADLSQNISINYLFQLGNFVPYVGYNYGLHSIKVKRDVLYSNSSIVYYDDPATTEFFSGYILGAKYSIKNWDIFIERKELFLNTHKLNQVDLQIGTLLHFDLGW